MGATAPPIYTVSHITVKIDSVADPGNMNTLLFSACTTPDWSIDAPKHVFHGASGKPNESIISSVQNPTYGTVTLTQGWDDAMVLAKWKAAIEQPGDIATKKKSVDIQFCKTDGSELFTWHADAALLTGYSHSGSDASSNGVLTITATLDADKWEQRVGGSPIT